jgi:hypothetical protein
MNNEPFRHLNAPTCLAVEFIAVFSRFEYALKSTDFAMGGPTIANPAWDKFSNSIHDQFVQIEDESLEISIAYMMFYPPRKQVLLNNKLDFKVQEIDTNQRSTQQLLGLVRTVRNNLFHGGKYSSDGEIDEGRNEKLLTHSLKILKYCLPLHKEVLASYER